MQTFFAIRGKTHTFVLLHVFTWGAGKGMLRPLPTNVSGEMVHQVIHNATVTLQLSFYLSVDERVEALRAAGIPVDERGNATAGYLFVRTTGRVGKRKNTYRWFAAGIGEEAHAGDMPSKPDWAEEQFAHADEIDIAAALRPAAPELVPATVAYCGCGRNWSSAPAKPRATCTGSRSPTSAALGPRPMHSIRS
ncbi:hypothetical protein J2W37_002781 [Variovorax paradoxus]|uniref:Uncharacterized protein n=1 Tax=Variovorax paradoxus TaxID=34073 RepID=A0AAE3Y329_VARPD|nr:hypothetical protein [Variovorax paradoxus]MDP9965061.1 hypothetical protein [Variovorax paradoxus]MDR6428438.1 hypothetical protein [Variovorax paradoxus]MDR6455092.1 hypothetical protein [Variovorax paradoxus]